MPQQSLLPNHQPMTGLEITISSYPFTGDIETVHITAKVRTGAGHYKTCWAGSLRGSGRDYLNTLVEDMTSAYMYGEVRRDIQKAAARTKKLADAHALATDF